MRDATLAGVGLAGEQRARYNKIAERLAELKTAFSNNVLDSAKFFQVPRQSPPQMISAFLKLDMISNRGEQGKGQGRAGAD